MNKQITGVYPVAGRQITAVQIDRNRGEDMITIDTDQGKIRMYHVQDCCEIVRIEDVTGDVEGLVGATIREFRATAGESDDGAWPDHRSWTLYDLVTDRADVQFRWIGESNGYYSEDVLVEIDGVEVVIVGQEVPCTP